jgi:hypothetical protein
LELFFNSELIDKIKKMHSIDFDICDSPQIQTPIIGDKLANGSPQKTFDDVWDRKPVNPSTLSRMNSISSMAGDCLWDYTVELECLNGPQGTCFSFVLNIFVLFLVTYQAKMKRKKVESHRVLLRFHKNDDQTIMKT